MFRSGSSPPSASSLYRKCYTEDPCPARTWVALPSPKGPIPGDLHTNRVTLPGVHAGNPTRTGHGNLPLDDLPWKDCHQLES